VRLPDRAFPVATVGFRGGLAVAHVADGPTSMALLRGDGSVSPDQLVEVPIMNDAAQFSGDVSITPHNAWACWTISSAPDLLAGTECFP
jgi:hypothetical protein